MASEPSERGLLFIIGSVHFVNVLDFMMVMPLGPDFARALHIPTSELGLVGGSYTLAAAAAGLVGAKVLDRFDRRKALAWCLTGLFIGTALGGFAQGLWSLLFARVVAGAFGGPATSIGLAVIADAVPEARRGRALGAVMGAFSVASVLGVPAGLELARLGDWRSPFFAVAGLGLALNVAALRLLPPMRKHLNEQHGIAERPAIFAVLKRPAVRFSLSATALLFASNFMVVPNLSTFIQFNAGYPRESLGLLYMAGGVVSFASMRIAGALVDRQSAALVALGGTVFFIGNLVTSLVPEPPFVPMLLFFVLMMGSNSFRAVAMNTQSSKVPSPRERAGFMSLQSTVHHVAASLGAIFSSRVLVEGADHRLLWMSTIVWVSAGLSVFVPLLLFLVAERLQRESEARQGVPIGAL